MLGNHVRQAVSPASAALVLQRLQILQQIFLLLRRKRRPELMTIPPVSLNRRIESKSSRTLLRRNADLLSIEFAAADVKHLRKIIGRAKKIPKRRNGAVVKIRRRRPNAVQRPSLIARGPRR